MLKLFIFKYLSIFLLLASSSFSRADILPEYIEKLDTLSENLFLKVIVYYDYSHGVSQKTELTRNELNQIEEAVVMDASGENLSKYVYSYDENGYQTSMLTYAYKNDSWHPQKEDEYLFDDKGRQVMSAKYEYINDNKIGDGEKWIKIFNENGICTNYETFTWKNNAWESFMQQETTINALGNISGIKTMYATGDMSTNVSFVYNVFTGLLERETYQKWDNGSFVNSFCILYTYDASQRITGEEIQSFEDNTWKTFEKRVFTYSDSDKKTTVTRHVFSTDGEKISETGFVSNAGDAIVTSSDGTTWKHKANSTGYTLSKQTSGNTWEDVMTYSYTNNDDFANTLEMYSGNKKTYQLIWETPLDEPDQLVFLQEYMDDSGKVETEKKMIFSFTDVGIIKTKEVPETASFKIYPNPVVDFLTVEVPSELSSDVNYFIYNTLGKLVTRGKLYNRTQEINLSDLPSGQYIFNVLLNGKSYSSILLKK